MQTLSASEARANLYRLIDDAATSHEPVVITGKRNNAILIAEEDWSAIQETLYLLSVPGMRESIHDGMNTAVSECEKELDW
ncbi:type II toxin-antitoxin system Phd/YefM family antitoxin [Methylobacter sp.]|uniref:type II toxin-antitoxin system Phd/YefM family antitoxin n=1 Tax=Methylobacter sp. TaxID=2051955 RepID=UPI002FDD3B31